MSSKYHSHPAIAAVQQTTTELDEFSKATLKDFFEAVKQLDANPSQFWRRTTIRILASSIEGLTYLMKQCVLKISPVFKVSFSDEDLSFLQEVWIEKNAKGEVVKEKPRFTRFVENFKRTGACFCKVNRSSYVPSFGDKGFEHFQEMVKIRDRLMHPKSVASLDISDKELEQVQEAWKWVNEYLRIIFVECNKSRDAFLKSLVAEKKNPKA